VVRPLLLSLLLALLLAAPAAAAPNVVLIETDDQTLESMRVMERTRALLGDQGTTFENAFVSLSLCCPSRTSLLTGRYAHNHGVLDIKSPWGGFERLDGSETLAVWLQRAGYATVLLGKYLNRYGRRDPAEVPYGWTEWHGLVDPSTYGYYRYTFNDDGVLRRFGASEADYQTDVISARAEEIVARRAASPQPFFLWVSYLAPHNGLPREADDPPGTSSPVPAPRHAGRFATESLPRTPAFDEADVRDKPPAIRRRPRLGARQVAAIEHHYRQELESLLAVDEGVARIVGALERAGELEDTLLVFTSDNGYLHGEHRAPAGKVLAYEPSIRVPLLMRGPGVPRALRLGQLAANVDLAPTILEAAGASGAWTPDGMSLFEYLRDPGLETGRDLLIEGPARRADGLPRFAGVRSTSHLLLERDTGDRELYDLARDPHQLRNLAGRPRSAPLEAALARRLERLRWCMGADCRLRPDLALTLRALPGGPGRSVGCRFVVGLSGRARARVRSARLSVDGLPVARLRRGSLRGVVRAGSSTVRARVRLRDDRVVTLDRALPGC
jgi:N-acetylglucosamine-6-sulfatase